MICVLWITKWTVGINLNCELVITELEYCGLYIDFEIAINHKSFVFAVVFSLWILEIALQMLCAVKSYN